MTQTPKEERDYTYNLETEKDVIEHCNMFIQDIKLNTLKWYTLIEDVLTQTNVLNDLLNEIDAYANKEQKIIEDILSITSKTKHVFGSDEFWSSFRNKPTREILKMYTDYMTFTNPIDTYIVKTRPSFSNSIEYALSHLETADDLASGLEDQLHGEHGTDITKVRIELNEIRTYLKRIQKQGEVSDTDK